MATLYLTKDERAIFEKLPADAKKDVEVIEETLTFIDSEQKMTIRIRNMDAGSPALANIQNQAKNAKSPAELLSLAETVDFSSLSEKEATELYFAMGPNALTIVIVSTLSGVTSADQMLAVSALTAIRHSLLVSLSPSVPA